MTTNWKPQPNTARERYCQDCLDRHAAAGFELVATGPNNGECLICGLCPAAGCGKCGLCTPELFESPAPVKVARDYGRPVEPARPAAEPALFDLELVATDDGALALEPVAAVPAPVDNRHAQHATPQPGCPHGRCADVDPAAPTRDVIGLLLREGDVIVDPDGGRHTVVDRAQLDFNCVDVHTDTGIHLHMTWFEAKSNVYAVLVK